MAKGDGSPKQVELDLESKEVALTGRRSFFQRRDFERPSHVIEITSGSVGEGIGGCTKIGTRHTTHEQEQADAHEDCDLIQFGAVEYLVWEYDRAVELTVERRGQGARSITVHWRTENVSVVPSSYRDQSGTLTLGPGQLEATFAIEIIDNSQWNNETQQLVHLSLASADQGHVYLGELSSTTVYILNDDAFPHGIEDSSNQPALVLGFLQDIYSHMPQEAKWGMACKLYAVIFFGMNQLAIRGIIDAIDCVREKPDACGGEIDVAGGCSLDSEYRLYGWVFILVINFLLNLASERYFQGLRLAGKARQMLRSAIVHHTVQLSPNAMQHFTVGKVSKIVDQQVRVALETTWDAAFSLEAAVCRICGAVALALFLMWDPSISVGWRISTFASFLPFTMIAFNVVLLGRSIGRLSQLSQESIDAVAAWSEYMMEAMSLRPLIMSYKLGYATATEFTRLHKDANARTFRASRYQADTVFTAELFSLILAVAFILYAGLRMQRHEEMEIATFISAYNTIQAFGGMLAQIFSCLFLMGEGIASIREVAELLNSDTRRRLLLLSSVERQEDILKFDTLFPGRNRDNILMRELVYQFNDQKFAAFPPVRTHAPRARATRLSATCSIPTLPPRVARS